MKYAAVLLVFPLLLPAQEEAKKAGLSGKVVDALTGQPLRKANLMLMSTAPQSGPVVGPPPMPRAESDSEGNFVFQDLAPGTYTLSGERLGYVRASYNPEGKPDHSVPLRVETGQEISRLVLKLLPQALITGRILDADGEPVTRVMVSLARYADTPQGQRLMLFGSSSTNDLGEYRLAGIQAGTYLVLAMPQPTMSGFPAVLKLKPVEEREPEFTATFYPGVLESDSAQKFTLSAGQTMANVEFVLQKRKLLAIRGKVVPAVRDARIALLRADMMGMMFGSGMPSTVDKDGNFLIPGLVPAAYTVILLEGSGPMRSVRRVNVDLGKNDVEGLVLAYSPPLRMSGKVIVEGDRDAYAKKFGAALDLSALRLQCMVANGPSYGVANSKLSEEGDFQFDQLGVEEYRVNLFPLPPGTYLKSISLGGREIPDGRLDLRNGVPGELEFRISTEVSSLAGTVSGENGQPLPGASVLIARMPFIENGVMRNRIVRTDQDGRFNVEFLGPGEYRVLAYQFQPGRNLFSSENWPKVEAKAEKISLSVGVGGSVSLRLFDPEGKL